MVKTDQGVGAETHDLPEDKDGEEVIREDEPQHGRCKEGEEDKESSPSGVGGHIVGGEDMDQQGDP